MMRCITVIALALVSSASLAASRNFYDGFEAGNTNLWSQDGSRNKCIAVTSGHDSTSPRAGSYMAECNWDGTVAWNDPASYSTLYKSGFPNVSETFFRVWHHDDADVDVAQGSKMLRLGSDGTSFIDCQFEGGATSSLFAYFYTDAGQIASPYWGGAENCKDGQWHQLEVYVLNDTNGSNGTIKVWADDILIWQATGVDSLKGTNVWTYFWLMSNWSPNPGWEHDANNHFYWDDFEAFSSDNGGDAVTGSMSAGTIQVSAGGDTTAPTVSNPQPTGNLAQGTTNTDISVDATDAGTVVGCKYDTSNVVYDSMANTLTFDTGTTWKANVTGLSDGNAYTYYARCIDNSSNANGASTTIAFSVDLAVPPSVAITNSPPAKTILTTPPLQFTITDADGTGSTVYDLTWGGDCDGPATIVGTGLKQVSFDALSVATHSNCTLMLSDPEANDSDVENITSFEIVAAQTFFGQTNPGADVQEGSPGSELGLYFKTDTNGDLLGVRFWRLPASGEAPHTVQLWNPSGTPSSLASKTSSAEPFNGQWVDVFFDSPVAVTAGTPYVVSFHTPAGQYGLQDAVFENPVTVGNLYAYGNPETEGALNVANGAYFDGTTQFPSNHSSFGNGFGVDVLFQSGGDTTPPVISGCGPSGAQAWDVGSVSLSCTTDEAATCKYGYPAGVAYASIANTFSTTGSTSHSQTVPAVEGRVAHWYVRCIDGSGNANTADVGVHWTVNTRPFGRLLH